MNKYKAILFDKDGTLIDFNQTWLQIWQNVKVYLHQEYHVDELLIQQIEVKLGIVENHIQDGIYLFGTMEQWVHVIGESMGVRQDILMMHVHELVSNYFLNLKQYPYIGNVRETLLKLKNDGYLLGLVTNDLKEHAYDFLEKSELFSIFDYVVGDNLKDALKPDPQSAIQFCELFDLKQESIVMVGDSYNDLLYAQNAGLGLYLGINQDGVESINSIEEVIEYL